MKSKSTAALLALFLGGFGAHKFYLGKNGLGVLYLLLCWTGIPSIAAFIEFFIYVFMSQEDFDAKYNANRSVVQNEDLNAYPDALFKLAGVAGNLYVFENRIILDRTSSTSAKILSGLSGNKTIPMKSIQSVQFKEAGSAFNGFIQFGILGGVESNGGILAAGVDENSVFFTKSENDKAKQIKEYIEGRIYNDTPSQTIITQNISSADELLKLKELQDKGIISREEFEAQKAKLLKSK